ncbi:VanZ family protein [Candidatus Bathyarchaeota archaeon]|nr:VanZ family protein [Candidatus Bathyarchaeota archaeon]
MANDYFNLKWLTIATVFTTIVVLFTHIPQAIMPERLQVSGLDKIEHIVAYGAITFLFILSLRDRFSLLSAAILFFAISALGAVDELTQPLVNRVASPVDWLADIVGISVVLLAFVGFNHSKRQAVTNANV